MDTIQLYPSAVEQSGRTLTEGQPALAKDPNVAASLLAVYLRNKHARIKYAIFGGDLKQARKLVNGGSHGFERFKDTFEKGLRILAG